MDEVKSYTARAPWTPERPETLVVCCSDGRWHAPIMEYVDHEVSEHADLYAVPGGPAAFDPWSSSFDEARVLDQALHLFAQYHDLHGAWLIAHRGCAYYEVHHPGTSESGREEHQLADLRRAHALLKSRYPNLEVRLVFADLEGERVVFRQIDPHQPTPALLVWPATATAPHD